MYEYIQSFEAPNSDFDLINSPTGIIGLQTRTYCTICKVSIMVSFAENMHLLLLHLFILINASGVVEDCIVLVSKISGKWISKNTYM